MTKVINTIDVGLSLREYDPYQNGVIDVFPNGDQLLRKIDIQYVENIEDKYHTVVKGETLTQIAYTEYIDEVEHPQFYYWIIALANQIDNPLDISYLVGQDILIPAIDEYKRQYNNAENEL